MNAAALFTFGLISLVHSLGYAFGFKIKGDIACMTMSQMSGKLAVTLQIRSSGCAKTAK